MADIGLKPMEKVRLVNDVFLSTVLVEHDGGEVKNCI
jgi:hypothetical protein